MSAKRRVGVRCGPRGAAAVSRDGTALCRRRVLLAEEQLARAGEGTCSVLDRTLPFLTARNSAISRSKFLIRLGLEELGSNVRRRRTAP